MEQLHSSWYKKGWAEGQAAAHEEGLVSATRSAIVEYMETRFGVPAAEVARSVEPITDIERLQSLRRSVFGAKTQDEALRRIVTAQENNRS